MKVKYTNDSYVDWAIMIIFKNEDTMKQFYEEIKDVEAFGIDEESFEYDEDNEKYMGTIAVGINWDEDLIGMGQECIEAGNLWKLLGSVVNIFKDEIEEIEIEPEMD